MHDQLLPADDRAQIPPPDEERQTRRQTEDEPDHVGETDVSPPAAVEAEDDADKKLSADNDREARFERGEVLRWNVEFEANEICERVTAREDERMEQEKKGYPRACYPNEKRLDDGLVANVFHGDPVMNSRSIAAARKPRIIFGTRPQHNYFSSLSDSSTRQISEGPGFSAPQPLQAAPKASPARCASAPAAPASDTTSRS